MHCGQKMFSIVLVFSLATLGTANVLPKHYPFWSTRIVGGIPVSIEDFSYQVSLQVNDFHFCGGSILDADHIVTAGHCASDLQYYNAFVRAGSNSSSTGGSKHSIVWVKRHEDFGRTPSGTPINDIALVKVYPPFKIDNTRSPVTFYNSDEEIEDGEMSVISGYGYTREGGDSSNVLMAVEVPIVSRKRCDEIYKKKGYSGITEDFICAGTTEGGKDSCQGDSGGPVVVKGQLAGIVSFGLGCGRPGIPGVYTNVAYFTKWIAKNTL